MKGIFDEPYTFAVNMAREMDAAKFKYGNFWAGLPNCPPQDYAEIDAIAFRFLHPVLAHSDNFKPVQLISPSRRFGNALAQCQAFGLSFFEDAADARRFHEARTRKFPAFPQSVGNQIATIQVSPEDGLASVPEPANFGHFTFHEYLRCDFLQAGKIVSVQPIQS